MKKCKNIKKCKFFQKSLAYYRKKDIITMFSKARTSFLERVHISDLKGVFYEKNFCNFDGFVHDFCEWIVPGVCQGNYTTVLP